MIFETLSDEQLSVMSIDELVAENQRAGREVDTLRDYRRDLKERWSNLQRLEEIKAKHGDLSDEQVQAINAIVSAPRLTLKAGVKNNG